MVVYKLFLFLGFIALTGQVHGANDNDAAAPRPTRLYQKCEPLLNIPKPHLFAITREQKTALVFGTTSGESAYLLPNFAKDAIEHALHVLDTHAYANYLTESLMAEAEAAMDNPVDTHVIEALGEFGDAYVRYMKMAGQMEEDISTMPIGPATGILIQLSGSLMADYSAVEYARARSMNQAIDELDPEPTPEELSAFGDELNLGHGVHRLAQSAGARGHHLLSIESADEALAQMRSIAMLRDMVKTLLAIEKSQFKLADLQTTSIEDLDQAYDRMHKILPKIALDLFVMNRQITERIEHMFAREEKLLVNLELQFLVGSRGLLHSLERRGFTVKRIESDSDWQRLKASFAP